MFLQLETLRLGLANLRLHMLRSILTSLGIILGVAAVIVMVSIGEGQKQSALRDIESLGATNTILRSERPPESSAMGSQSRSFVAAFGMTQVDFRRLQEFLPDVEAIVPLKAVGSEVSMHDQRMVAQAFGTTPQLKDVARLHVQPGGRYLTELDMELRRPVAVIGPAIARQLFPVSDPVGQRLRLDAQVLTIIGVLEPVGLSGGAGSALVGRDLNRDIHIPLSTAQLEFGDLVMRRESGSFSGEEVELSEIYLSARSTEDVIGIANRARRILETGHPRMRDVEIIVPWELLENVKRTTFAMNLLLTAIAAISLVVGGIGIMNIMLASVVERTREIGVRRALGATRKHIVSQFLVETGTISAVGGLLGIGLGVGLSLSLEPIVPWILSLPAFAGAVESGMGTFQTTITLWSIIVSFAVAAATGIIFGIYPAILASRQDPIVALRHD
jgi:putative ABC transport system permease protein